MLPAFNIKYSRNGGIRFLRVGRIQLSLCICKAKPVAKHVVADLSASYLAARIQSAIRSPSAFRVCYPVD